MTDIQRFDPGACHFPRPAVPLLPALRWRDLAFDGATEAARLLDAPGAVHFARGRYAMHAAYRAAGVGPGKALLAPAYHCRTMIDPAFALGAAVSLYHMHADLTPDMDSLRAMISSGAAALVLPHYFGVEQPPVILAEVAALCRKHGVTLVEDCAHAWQVAEHRVPQRAGAGHMIVASPYKMFASEDGGVLWADAGGAGPAPRSLADELRGLRAVWERRRRKALPPLALPAAAGLARGSDTAEAGVRPSVQYHLALEGKQSLASSRWIVRHTPSSPMRERRRANYRQWQDALAGHASARVLFDTLPADCAPYMVPLLVQRPDPVFFQLKHAGMPIWRWDEMAISDCPVATAYRLGVLHLPCHQDLDQAQMAWMTALVARALA